MMREKFEKKALQMAVFQTMANVTAQLAVKDMGFGISYMMKFRVARDFLSKTAEELQQILTPENVDSASNEQFEHFCKVVETNTKKFFEEFTRTDAVVSNELATEIDKMFMSAPKWIDFLGSEIQIEEFSKEIDVDGLLISLVLSTFLQEVTNMEGEVDLSRQESSGILQ